MSVVDVVGIVLGVMSVLVIPLLIFIVKLSMRWTKVESNLITLTTSLQALVRDKDATHEVMLSTMRDDRNATDRRLRWLEEHLWNRRNERNAA